MERLFTARMSVCEKRPHDVNETRPSHQRDRAPRMFLLHRFSRSFLQYRMTPRLLGLSKELTLARLSVGLIRMPPLMDCACTWSSIPRAMHFVCKCWWNDFKFYCCPRGHSFVMFTDLQELECRYFGLLRPIAALKRTSYLHTLTPHIFTGGSRGSMSCSVLKLINATTLSVVLIKEGA